MVFLSWSFLFLAFENFLAHRRVAFCYVSHFDFTRPCPQSTVVSRSLIFLIWVACGIGARLILMKCGRTTSMDEQQSSLDSPNHIGELRHLSNFQWLDVYAAVLFIFLTSSSAASAKRNSNGKSQSQSSQKYSARISAHVIFNIPNFSPFTYP